MPTEVAAADTWIQVSLMLHLDDPLDAIAVHAWNGTWGLIAPGFFSTQVYIQVCPTDSSSIPGSRIIYLTESVLCLLAKTRTGIFRLWLPDLAMLRSTPVSSAACSSS